jgi:hypothetical protein
MYTSREIRDREIINKNSFHLLRITIKSTGAARRAVIGWIACLYIPVFFKVLCVNEIFISSS